MSTPGWLSEYVENISDFSVRTVMLMMLRFDVTLDERSHDSTSGLNTEYNG
jgi:hypothetical protein